MSTEVYREYLSGVDYKNEIGLYSTVDVNERFYAGTQWYGIPSEGLPTPVFNFIKRGVDWKVAQVKERALSISYLASGVGQAVSAAEKRQTVFAKLLTEWAAAEWEYLKMDFLNLEGLKDAAVSGDYLLYFYWDMKKSAANGFRGDISAQIIDSVNYYPGDVNEPGIERQPYIILVFRSLVSEVKKMAEEEGLSKKEIDLIRADNECEYQAGDMAKTENEDKCLVFLKMYKQKEKDGSEYVWFLKSTKDVTFKKPVKTKNRLYPIAKMSWYFRKNSAFGSAEVSSLIPNQVYANKAMALNMLHLIESASPRVIFDASRIKKWSNALSCAIPVMGDISGVASYMQPPTLSYDTYKMFDIAKSTSLEMMGANEAVLGDVAATNTSAFIAVRESALTPIASLQERFYNMVEDVARIWMDFFFGYYTEKRPVRIKQDSGFNYVYLPKTDYDSESFELKIDVGPAAMWSDISTVNNLNSLLSQGVITQKEFLERLPEGHLPDKEGIIERMKTEEDAVLGDVEKTPNKETK